jgi:hypothetical protein
MACAIQLGFNEGVELRKEFLDCPPIAPKYHKFIEGFSYSHCAMING